MRRKEEKSEGKKGTSQWMHEEGMKMCERVNEGREKGI